MEELDKRFSQHLGRSDVPPSVQAVKKIRSEATRGVDSVADFVNEAQSFERASDGRILSSLSAPPPVVETKPPPKTPVKRATRAPAKSTAKSAASSAKSAKTAAQQEELMERHYNARRAKSYQDWLRKYNHEVPEYDWDNMDPADACRVLEEETSHVNSEPFASDAIIGFVSGLETFSTQTALGRKLGWQLQGVTQSVTTAIEGDLRSDIDLIAIKYDVALSLSVEQRLGIKLAMIIIGTHYANKDGGLAAKNIQLSEEELEQPNWNPYATTQD